MEPEVSFPCSWPPTTCLRPETLQCSPHNSISWVFILILSLRKPLGLRSGLFTSGLPTKTLYLLIFSLTFCTCRSSHPWFDHPNNIWQGVQNILKHDLGLQFMQNARVVCFVQSKPVATGWCNCSSNGAILEGIRKFQYVAFPTATCSAWPAFPSK